MADFCYAMCLAPRDFRAIPAGLFDASLVRRRMQRITRWLGFRTRSMVASDEPETITGYGFSARAQLPFAGHHNLGACHAGAASRNAVANIVQHAVPA